MIISVENLSKSFGKKQVFNNLSLSFETGQTYCLLGKNGAGKSTLINILIGLLYPDSGIIKINDGVYDPDNILQKSKAGILTGEQQLIEELDGRSYLKFVGKLYGIKSDVLNERINSIVNYFYDSPDDIKKPISKYSTGMKKKIGVAAAVLHTPEILILDEPFSGLDPVAANQLVHFLKQYQNGSRIIFLSSHDLDYVQKVSTHIGVLNEGRMIFNGSIEEFTQNGKSQLDESLINLLDPEAKTKSLSWI